MAPEPRCRSPAIPRTPRTKAASIASTRHEDLSLFAAASGRFGSWNKALVAAGISVALDLAGHSLLEERVRVSDELLHAAAVSEFGLWETALGYAGISARDVGRCRDLTPERIKRQLRRLCTTGYDLGAKVNRSRDHAFYEAAVRHFGGWRDALAAAGVTLAHVSHRRPKHLDRETMLLWIQQRHAAGQSLVWSTVCLENCDHALAIRREFSSWRKALQAAGIQSAQ